MHLLLGRAREAERDFIEADRLLGSSASDMHRAITAHNLGYVAALRGQVPLALTRYDEAEAGYVRHREVPGELWRDRCELLLAAGLTAEARRAAQRAVDAATARREPAELAEARLRLAQAALADGDPATAQTLADQAARALTRQRRTGWAALAHWTVVLACAAQDPDSVTEAGYRRAADRLERAGWPEAALQARLRAGQRATTRARAQQHLEPVSRARRSGTVWHRQLGWHAEALLRRGRGDRAGALRAVARGLDLADDHRATLGATDLRAAASAHVAELASTGLRLALDGGRPELVWRWAERTRAAALLHPPVHPPDDEDTEQALAELRTVVRERQDTATEGRAAPELARRQARLEERIRQAVRHTSGDGRGVRPDLDAGRLHTALDDRALVEFAECDGRLVAVVAVGGRFRLHRLGETAAVTRELHHLFHALRRMAAPGVDPAPGLRRRLEAAAARLDAQLLAPLSAELGDRDLVVVPTEQLHALPWGVLPTCAGRAFSVSPSATLWQRARSVPAGNGAVVLAAGPGLAHAEPEVKALADLRPGARVLAGDDARVADVLTAASGARLVHLAAHGRFRGDNPQFSAVDLADGPLTGYDLERLQHPPEVAVLSACETGAAAVLAGGELLGLAATLLSMGVRSVVAPVLQVPDAETAPLMLDLHRELLAGASVPAALAAAVARARAGSDADAATGAAFLCVGA
ncbi:CHAT domain-containing protein [Modestobacter roseus]|uniref:CHAT domain-containing protein n=1 Tax=Modestobacter roseus TaxID=1181884 RepID=UPI001294B1CB|nr:CHAT domain-containing protein [Modestobacter roseus]MQA35467.1 CHAT domain-containing protein [Modestobacter roseus]